MDKAAVADMIRKVFILLLRFVRRAAQPARATLYLSYACKIVGRQPYLTIDKRGGRPLPSGRPHDALRAQDELLPPPFVCWERSKLKDDGGRFIRHPASTGSLWQNNRDALAHQEL